MPKLKENQLPSYRLHKQSGQAVVTLSGKDFLLGLHGTAASKKEYERITGEWVANSRRLVTSKGDTLISELLLAFWDHAKTYYGKDAARGEHYNFRQVIKLLRTMYGNLRSEEFTPLKLKAVRGAMINAGWCRTYINRQVSRLRQIFKWGTENELVTATILEGLRAVAPLRDGKTEARESEPVKPVPEQHITAILTHMSRQVKALVELQAITGARPGELVIMRTCDIDTTGKNWIYKPTQHKTLHRGHDRTIFIGPRARLILKPFLRPNVQEYIFSPAEAEGERLEKLREERTTPQCCGNTPGSNRVRRPRRRPAERYSVASYRRAIARACERAFNIPAEIMEPRTVKEKKIEAALPAEVRKQRRADRAKARAEWRRVHVWHPHQLRHNAATRWRKEFGAEAALVLLGDKTTRMIDVYAEKNVEAAQKIMARVG